MRMTRERKNMKKVRRFLIVKRTFRDSSQPFALLKETEKRDAPPLRDAPSQSELPLGRIIPPFVLPEPLTKLMDRPYFRWGYLSTGC